MSHLSAKLGFLVKSLRQYGMVEFTLFRLADGTFVHRQVVLPRKNTSCHVVYGFCEQDVQESVFAKLQYNISNLKKCVVTYTSG